MNSPEPEPQGLSAAPSANVLEMGRICELTQAGRHSEALAAAEAFAVAVPRRCDLMYLIAVNQRCLDRVAEALDTLEQLRQQSPGFGRLYQEQGYCYVALHDPNRAIAALRRAVSINPALPESWSMLERLYRLMGDLRSAAMAAEHLTTLKLLPPELVQAGSLFSEGDLAQAERLVRAYLLTAGDHVEALRLLGRIAHQRNALDDAERLLEKVIKIVPDYRAARADYARVLIARQKHARAREEVDVLLELEPHNRDYLLLRAGAYAGLGGHEEAIRLFQELLAASPAWPQLQVLLGHSLKAVGRGPEAIESYRAAAASRPGFGDAYWSLANLKTYRFSGDDIERMRAEETDPTTPFVDRYHLCFALGKALEDRGEFADSWQCYARGNALKCAESRYRPEFTETNTRKQIEVCTAQFFASRAGSGVPDPDPILIVGLPRSGSTLVEQILASHSQVEGTQELYDIPRLVLELQGRGADPHDPRYPAVLAELSPEEFRALGARYMSDTRAYRQGRGFFIDKMPNNFRHIGLIHLMMPNAKIIDVRRSPLPCCVGNLKQLYASGQDFSYGVEDIARYYRTYLELMRHWDRVLPGRVLRICYEDVVEDLETSVRRILKFCTLPFEGACIDFHNTERAVSTASSEQVRRPIYREGLHQWRNYEPWLGPLKEALGDALVRYRD
ncbi:MAG: sulfotransferase [Steroidobacteraceae bacterium]|jgi:tetratricopeptide (TPR) repeat protein